MADCFVVIKPQRIWRSLQSQRWGLPLSFEEAVVIITLFARTNLVRRLWAAFSSQTIQVCNPSMWAPSIHSLALARACLPWGQLELASRRGTEDSPRIKSINMQARAHIN